MACLMTFSVMFLSFSLSFFLFPSDVELYGNVLFHYFLSSYASRIIFMDQI